MKKTSVSLLAAVTALTFAGSASAQICNGFPTLDGQFSLGGVAYFPEDLDQFGVEGSYNLAGPLAVHAGYLNTSSSEEGVDGSLNTFIAGASFDITSLIGTTPAAISLCPTAEFQYTSEDDFTSYGVPIGLGFGTSLPLGATSSVQPFVVPQVLFAKSKLDTEVGDVESDWENEFGIRAGANVTFGQFFVGGEVRKIFEEGNDAVFGVKAGIRI